MGYDYTLNTKEKNKCDHCGRSDGVMELVDSGMTWNHNYPFFEIFGDEGFRGTVYHKPLTKLIPDLELILEWIKNSGNEGDWLTDYRLNYQTLRHDNPNKPKTVTIMNLAGKPHEATFDGWCATNGNAYYFINELLEQCKEHVGEHPDAEWSGD